MATQSLRTTLRSGAATSPFAHLLGLGKSKADKAAERDAARLLAASAEDDDGDKDDKDKDGKKSKKAKGGAAAEDDPDRDDDDDEEAAEEETDGGEDVEDDDDKKDGKRSKKAKGKASDDDKDDEEAAEDDGDDYAQGRKAERSRWAKVLSSPAAGSGRTAAACQLLATSSLSATAIIATLETLPAGGRGQLADRMAGVRPPKPGVDAPGDHAGAVKPGADLAAQIVRAGKIRRGESAD